VAGKHLDAIHELIKGPVGTSIQLSLENDWDPEGSNSWVGSAMASALKPFQHAPSSVATASSEHLQFSYLDAWPSGESEREKDKQTERDRTPKSE